MNARLSFAAAALSFAFAATPAMAGEYVCTGTVGSASLDNIFVPDGATCTLDRTRAKGNIVVGTGASLYARSISINGNVQAEGAHLVNIGGTSSVGGSVQLVQGGSATITKVTIKGNLQMESNNGLLKATNNVIDGDLQAFQNSGGVRLVKNRIDGNLQCKENSPAPTGNGNRADSKEDQCSRL